MLTEYFDSVCTLINSSLLLPLLHHCSLLPSFSRFDHYRIAHRSGDGDTLGAIDVLILAKQAGFDLLDPSVKQITSVEESVLHPDGGMSGQNTNRVEANTDIVGGNDSDRESTATQNSSGSKDSTGSDSSEQATYSALGWSLQELLADQLSRSGEWILGRFVLRL